MFIYKKTQQKTLLFGELFVVLVSDLFLRLLVYAGKRGQHHGERLLSAQYRHAGQLLPVRCRGC